MRPDGQSIAYLKTPGSATGPGVLWLSGFKSDMAGTKAAALDAWARERGRAYTRFDYFGHGRSSGTFAEGTVSRWLDDALAVLDQITEGPQVLVGSSMGGWIATLVALRRPARIAGLVLIAPATDFTEELIWKNLPEAARRDIMDRGGWLRPSAYDPEPYPITRALIEDGRRHLILGAQVGVRAPVRVLQGMADPDVPYTHALKLVSHLPADDVTLSLIPGGDHRLSRPQDLAMMIQAVESIIAQAEA